MWSHSFDRFQIISQYSEPQWRHRGAMMSLTYCLRNKLFKLTSAKYQICGILFCEVNPSVPSQRYNNVERFSMPWHLHGTPGSWRAIRTSNLVLAKDPGLLATGVGLAFWKHVGPDSMVPGANMGPSGADRTQVGPMLAPRNLLSGALDKALGWVRGWLLDI